MVLGLDLICIHSYDYLFNNVAGNVINHIEKVTLVGEKYH